MRCVILITANATNLRDFIKLQCESVPSGSPLFEVSPLSFFILQVFQTITGDTERGVLQGFRRGSTKPPNISLEPSNYRIIIVLVDLLNLLIFS